VGRERERTLLVAVLLSAWGPPATLVALLLGPSTTQLADLIRRTAELVALIVAWSVQRAVRRGAVGADALERRAAGVVALALAVSGGLLVIALALRGLVPPGGDARLGLAIASLGLVTNTVFWWRSVRLVRGLPGPLIDAQRRFYRAKTAVDAAVVATLATLVAGAGAAVVGVDIAGTAAVAVYLLVSAWRTVTSLQRR